MNWKLKLGNFLFKYRSFTPVPLIVIVFIFFKPVIRPGWDTALTLAGSVMVIFGELIRVISVGFSFEGTSGRENFLRADNLNVTGIYSLLRNPLYAGNLFIYTGLLLVYSNWWALLLFDVLLISQYYFIILSEEDFLRKRYGSEYERYRELVNPIIPSFREFKKPSNRFDKVKVIYKENDSVFNSLFILLCILIYRQSIVAGSFEISLSQGIFCAVLVVFYIALKIKKSSFKKKNRR